MNPVYAKVGEFGSAYGKESVMLSMGYIKMNEPSPSIDHVAQEDGAWVIPPEKLEELYQADLVKYVDPETKHYSRHIALQETERAADALLRLRIAQAEIKEKYGKGSIVYVTETGTHYHTDINCSSLTTSDALEINLSKGLKEYSPCSKCVNNN